MPTNDYIITGNKAYLEDFKTHSAEVESYISDAEAILGRIKAEGVSANIAEEMAILNEVKESWAHMKHMSTKIFASGNPVGNRGVARLMEEMDYRWGELVVERLSIWYELDRQEHEAALEASDSAWMRSWIIMSGGIAVIAAFGVYFAFYYSGLFVGPIEAMRQQAESISKGDFKAKVETHTGDELESLADSMNSMSGQLDTLYSKMEQIVDDRTRELNEANSNLRESEERYRRVVEFLPDAILVHMNGEVIYANKEAIRVFAARDAGDLAGRQIFDFLDNDYHQASEGRDIPEGGGEAPLMESRVKRIDGVTIDAEVSSVQIKYGDRPVFITALRDITGRKRMERELKENEERYKILFNGINDAVFVHGIPSGKDSSSFRFTDVNDVACRRLGYAREELLNMSPVSIDAPGMDSLRDAATKESSGKGQLIFEMVHMAKDGRRIPVEINARRFEINGRAMIMSVARDITERKKAEEVLRQSEEKYRQIVETGTEGIWVIDTDNKTSFVNKKMADDLGYTVEEMMGKALFDFMDGEGRAIAEFYIERHRLGIKEQHDFKFRRNDGSDFWALVSTAPLIDKDNKYMGALEMVSDINDRKKAEETLKERIGELEMFRKLTLKREIRLRELKDKVEELEKELKGVKAS
ncbi:MAG: PAS domain S-box protein [Deltaproteobacteria bacterium]|nr:PAS domain S-box protein [Deltaproteobacteria bacterium]